MKKGLLALAVIIAAAFSLSAFADDFKLCKGTYALCTTAVCKSMPGKRGFVSCRCDVSEGYSAGTKDCEEMTKTDKGDQIYSRYYPIKSYVSCQNSAPWAWCLDSPCIIDKKDPTKAACKCSIVENKSPYVIVTNKYTATTCHSESIISSALVSDVNAMTDFLDKQNKLKPFPIKVQKGE